ncbi:transposase [Pandoraea sputorum]|uniref:Transposase n=1 Tax=Pandoraea sputorum TaxID=93222 RepID=A0A5E5BKV0_9BURK|nr:transposase [Pandoraea sputorum]
MPAHRTTMRRIKEVLRLKWACHLSHRQVRGALGTGLGTITQYLQLASAAGLDWAAVEPLPEDELERLLLSAPSQVASARWVDLDYAAVHRELRRKSVTLQLLWEEYITAHPGQRTYRYTQFCQRYRDWAKMLKRSMRQQHQAGEKLFADFAGQTVPILDREGGVAFDAHIFVAVLGASNVSTRCVP